MRLSITRLHFLPPSAPKGLKFSRVFGDRLVVHRLSWPTVFRYANIRRGHVKLMFVLYAGCERGYRVQQAIMRQFNKDCRRARLMRSLLRSLGDDTARTWSGSDKGNSRVSPHAWKVIRKTRRSSFGLDRRIYPLSHKTYTSYKCLSCLLNDLVYVRAAFPDA